MHDSLSNTRDPNLASGESLSFQIDSKSREASDQLGQDLKLDGGVRIVVSDDVLSDDVANNESVTLGGSIVENQDDRQRTAEDLVEDVQSLPFQVLNWIGSVIHWFFGLFG